MKQPRMPSPAILVAVLALVAALAGTAVAGRDASTSAITKKKVKSIATKQINELAPGLSVASAQSSQNADALDGQDSTAFLGANGKAADADQLDGQDSSSFVPASALTSGRRLIDDPTPGDGLGRVGQPLLTNDVRVDFTCTEDYVANDEQADVAIFTRGDPISVSAWPTTGTAVNTPDVGTGVSVLRVQRSFNDVGSVYFVALASNGHVASGSVSAEVNDTAAPGSDCTFGGNIIAP